jgi:hypothetical protein
MTGGPRRQPQRNGKNHRRTHSAESDQLPSAEKIECTIAKRS